jgi:chromosome segregation ATPase
LLVRDLEAPAARKREELAKDKDRCSVLESKIKEGEAGLKGLEEEMGELQSAIEKIDLDQAKTSHDMTECKRKAGKISSDLER